jgi:hypothetical protein
MGSFLSTIYDKIKESIDNNDIYEFGQLCENYKQDIIEFSDDNYNVLLYCYFNIDDPQILIKFIDAAINCGVNFQQECKHLGSFLYYVCSQQNNKNKNIILKHLILHYPNLLKFNLKQGNKHRTPFCAYFHVIEKNENIDYDVVKLMIENGAKCDDKEMNPLTYYLDYYKYRGNFSNKFDIIELLIKHGAKCDDENNNLLENYLANDNNFDKDIIDLLIKNGTPINNEVKKHSNYRIYLLEKEINKQNNQYD